MAGNYPDVPSWRIPWDRDGSVLVHIDSSDVISQLGGSNLQVLNDESNSAVGMSYSLCVIFPRLMDIDGGFWAGGADAGGYTIGFAWSPDTTNGVDGTWTPFTPSSAAREMGTVNPDYREDIWSSTIGGVRAIKYIIASGGYAGTPYCRAFHLYGEPTSGEDENRLEVWHPTLNQRVDPAYFDFGNVQRGSSHDKTFRIKNRSATLTANDVRLSFDALTDTTPSVPGQFQVSSDGVNFYAQRTISAIAPGAISSVYTMRKVTPSDAVLSLWTLRLNVEATTGWS